MGKPLSTKTIVGSISFLVLGAIMGLFFYYAPRWDGVYYQTYIPIPDLLQGKEIIFQDNACYEIGPEYYRRGKISKLITRKIDVCDPKYKETEPVFTSEYRPGYTYERIVSGTKFKVVAAFKSQSYSFPDNSRSVRFILEDENHVKSTNSLSGLNLAYYEKDGKKIKFDYLKDFLDYEEKYLPR